jgi:hypothetical protein
VSLSHAAAVLSPSATGRVLWLRVAGHSATIQACRSRWVVLQFAALARLNVQRPAVFARAVAS